MIKGLIAAGGHATRLRPVTFVTNKHLLPVYDRPMIYHPIETLRAAGVTDILLVSGREHAGHFLNLLGSGRDLGVRLSYEVQEEAGGIAQVLSLAEDFVGKEQLMMILGDNIFEETEAIAAGVEQFRLQGAGARIFLKEVHDAHRFGVAEVRDGRIVSIEEKPSHPKSRLAVTGLYLYDADAFSIAKELRPSARGELEITAVNNAYVARGDMGYQVLAGEWTDAGTFDSLLRANMIMARRAGRLP